MKRFFLVFFLFFVSNSVIAEELVLLFQTDITNKLEKQIASTIDFSVDYKFSKKDMDDLYLQYRFKNDYTVYVDVNKLKTKKSKYYIIEIWAGITVGSFKKGSLQRIKAIALVNQQNSLLYSSKVSILDSGFVFVRSTIFIPREDVPIHPEQVKEVILDVNSNIASFFKKLKKQSII